MPNLTIPEAIAENPHLLPSAKLLFAVLFGKIKKGDKPRTGLRSFDTIRTVGDDDVIACIRSLVAEGYCSVDDAVSRLEDVLDDQELQLTCHVHLQVMPRLDPELKDERRYGGEIGWDEVQIGRTIYKGVASVFMNEYTINVTRRDDEGESTVASGVPFKILREAWDWFDAMMVGFQDNGPTVDADPLIQWATNLPQDSSGVTLVTARALALICAHERCDQHGDSAVLLERVFEAHADGHDLPENLAPEPPSDDKPKKGKK